MLTRNVINHYVILHFSISFVSGMPYSASALPLALLDLTLLRVGAAPIRVLTSVGTLARWQRAPGWRKMHQVATAPPMEIEEFLVGPPAKCVSPLSSLLDFPYSLCC